MKGSLICTKESRKDNASQQIDSNVLVVVAVIFCTDPKLLENYQECSVVQKNY